MMEQTQSGVHHRHAIGVRRGSDRLILNGPSWQ